MVPREAVRKGMGKRLLLTGARKANRKGRKGAWELHGTGGDLEKAAAALQAPPLLAFEDNATIIAQPPVLTAEDKTAICTIRRYGVAADVIIMTGGLSAEGGVGLAGSPRTASVAAAAATPASPACLGLGRPVPAPAG